MKILNFRHSMYNSSICPLTINCTKNNSTQANNQRKIILCKNSTQGKEFSHKIRSLWLCHITQSKKEKPNTKQWHCSCTSSKIFLSFCMCSIIQKTNTKKQSRTSNSMSLHCKNRSKNTYFIHCKQSKYNHTHMSNTTISNNFFQINLSKCGQTCINDPYQTNCTHKRSKISTCIWKKIEIKTLESISSKFQQDSSQLDTSSCTSFNMSFRQPQMKWHKRNFHCKSQKKSPPQNKFTTWRNLQMSLLFIMECSCSTIQKLQHRLHCQTSYKCIKNQQISSFHFTCTTSTLPNKQKHRQLNTLIKYIKTK